MHKFINKIIDLKMEIATKDETSETILRNLSFFLHWGFLAGQNWFISVANQIVKQQTTQLGAVTEFNEFKPRLKSLQNRF